MNVPAPRVGVDYLPARNIYRKMDYAKVDKARAKEIGQKFYWGKKACKRDHYHWRYVSTGSCVECQANKAKTDLRKKITGANKLRLTNDRAVADAAEARAIDNYWGDM